MSYAKKNMRNLTGSILGVVVAAALGVWQFSLFVTFKGSEGGTSDLWWAIALALAACGVAFLVFSVFIRHDTDDELHITSTRRS